MRYEYKIQTCAKPEVSEDQLNRDFGSHGWKLVQILPWDGKWYFYFVRAITDHEA